MYFFGMVVVPDHADAGERVPHHRPGAFLPQDAHAKKHGLFACTRRFHGRLTGIHPLFGLGVPTSLHARELLVWLSGSGQPLVSVHHGLHVHLAIVLLFFGHHKRRGHNTTQRGETICGRRMWPPSC